MMMLLPPLLMVINFVSSLVAIVKSVFPAIIIWVIVFSSRDVFFYIYIFFAFIWAVFVCVYVFLVLCLLWSFILSVCVFFYCSYWRVMLLLLGFFSGGYAPSAQFLLYQNKRSISSVLAEWKNAKKSTADLIYEMEIKYTSYIRFRLVDFMAVTSSGRYFNLGRYKFGSKR